MRSITVAEFHAEAKAQGMDRRDIAVICPSCKTVQSMSLFDKHMIEDERIQKQFGFSCIGRSAHGVGCDWTLGGLLKIHELEVVDTDGTVHLHFELATKEQAVQLHQELTTV